jgi:hypothetical protein
MDVRLADASFCRGNTNGRVDRLNAGCGVGQSSATAAKGASQRKSRVKLHSAAAGGRDCARGRAIEYYGGRLSPCLTHPKPLRSNSSRQSHWFRLRAMEKSPILCVSNHGCMAAKKLGPAQPEPNARQSHQRPLSHAPRRCTSCTPQSATK